MALRAGRSLFILTSISLRLDIQSVTLWPGQSYLLPFLFSLNLDIRIDLEGWSKPHFFSLRFELIEVSSLRAGRSFILLASVWTIRSGFEGWSKPLVAYFGLLQSGPFEVTLG